MAKRRSIQQLKVRLYFHSRFHDLISPKILPKDKRTRKGKVMRNYSRILFQFFLVSLFMPSFKRKTKANKANKANRKTEKKKNRKTDPKEIDTEAKVGQMLFLFYKILFVEPLN